MPRKSKLGRVDGVPMVAFRVSADEREAFALASEAAGAPSVNEWARGLARSAAGLDRPAGGEDRTESGVRVEYDEGAR